jgi:uncharacterized protein (DUF2345 family)
MEFGGVLISTDNRADAKGQVLDRQELIDQLETALALVKQLAELSASHQADRGNHAFRNKYGFGQRADRVADLAFQTLHWRAATDMQNRSAAARGRDYREPRESVEPLRQGRLH